MSAMNISAKLNVVLAMQVFARVVEAGTFTKAADSLQMPKATVTKLVQRMCEQGWLALQADEPGDYIVATGRRVTFAYALLDGGKSGEVRLKATDFNKDAKTEPTVIKNLKYWGASKNDGFILMPNTVEAYRVGDKQYEFKGTNGFMITFDVDSKTAPPAATGM